MTDKQRAGWTQKTAIHIDGEGFSSASYELFADGKATGIMRYSRTSGSPEYLITAESLQDGDETFDILASRGKGMLDWLNARWPRKESTEDPA